MGILPDTTPGHPSRIFQALHKAFAVLKLLITAIIPGLEAGFTP